MNTYIITCQALDYTVSTITIKADNKSKAIKAVKNNPTNANIINVKKA